MKHYVYWIHLPEHNDVTTEGYVGVTKNPRRRFKEHKRLKTNPHLKNVFLKYDNLQLTILYSNDEDWCYQQECILRPKECIGWNINKGGNKPPSNKGKQPSLETRVKRRESMLKYIQENGSPLLGRKHSKETIEKMQKPKSEKTKQKMRKPKSEKTKEKMRRAWKIRKANKCQQ